MFDLYEALTETGFRINDKLYKAYQNSPTRHSTGHRSFGVAESEVLAWSLGEEDISFYTDELKASWENDYNDVAIVMFRDRLAKD